MARIPWMVWFLVATATLWIVAWNKVDAFDEVLFNPVTTASIIGLLMPLLVVATFIERAVEVYVNTSRQQNKQVLERAAATDSTRKAELEEYQAETRQKAFLAGLILGTLVAIVGVRVLYPLMSFDHELEGIQGQWFGVVDVVLTGALLSGGAEPIHKIMSVITGYLDKWRP